MNIKIVLTVLILIIGKKVSGQQLPSNNNIIMDFRSNIYIRVFDGIRLKTNELPAHVKVNQMVTTQDTAKLKELGIIRYDKPYMILNSEVSDVRGFLSNKANLDRKFMDINLPIILNNKLITFNEYAKLNSLDTNKVTKVIYSKRVSEFIERGKVLPFGAILVTEK
jgi:hypothetical protein